jgi:hypothetical protein
MIIDVNTGLLSFIVQPDPNIMQVRRIAMDYSRMH